MKSESLVIADQPCRGEYVLESCTRVAMRSVYLIGDPSFVKTTEGEEVRSSSTVGEKRNHRSGSRESRPKGESKAELCSAESRTKLCFGAWVAVFSLNVSLWHIVREISRVQGESSRKQEAQCV
jgi:hypothetical protein